MASKSNNVGKGAGIIDPEGTVVSHAEYDSLIMMLHELYGVETGGVNSRYKLLLKIAREKLYYLQKERKGIRGAKVTWTIHRKACLVFEVDRLLAESPDRTKAEAFRTLSTKAPWKSIANGIDPYGTLKTAYYDGRKETSVKEELRILFILHDDLNDPDQWNKDVITMCNL